MSQCLQRGGIGKAVDPLGPEMPLKCGDDGARRIVVEARKLKAVAELDQLFLQILDRSTAVVRRECTTFDNRRWLDPKTDPRRGELRPGKSLARILLAR